MKALTLWPEWAALIAHGLKPVENRGWKLPEGERIAIHAGAHIGGRKGRPALEEADNAVYWTALAAGWEMHTVADRIQLRVGKKAAGRLLDGVEHNAFPEVSRG